jgi:hypothetical protein
MRELGVAAHEGTILGPDPKAPRDAKKEDDDDPHRDRRSFYSQQLGRSVSDEELSNYP